MRRQTWLEEFALELAAREVARADIAGIVVEASGHLDETAAAPLEAFGAPAAYAELVAARARRAAGAAARRGGARRGARADKRYRRHTVLDDVDLELHGGEAVLLMGRNGRGKSTAAHPRRAGEAGRRQRRAPRLGRLRRRTAG